MRCEVSALPAAYGGWLKVDLDLVAKAETLLPGEQVPVSIDVCPDKLKGLCFACGLLNVGRANWSFQRSYLDPKKSYCSQLHFSSARANVCLCQECLHKISTSR